MGFVLITNMMVKILSKRDLPQPKVAPFYRKLARELPMDIENREALVKAYMSYAENVEREEEKMLVKWKKKSYSRKFK